MMEEGFLLVSLSPFGVDGNADAFCIITAAGVVGVVDILHRCQLIGFLGKVWVRNGDDAPHCIGFSYV